HMLAIARGRVPQLHALLMDAATFSANHALAVTEPVHAPESACGALGPDEAALDGHLRAQEKGRLEQEFLPTDAVHRAVHAWASED
ncbi:Wadjet anti-phage system protein JetD domain-containing protein, partial [Escherichia coli]|uniref:Wadjet anti-phage system protein JetD domain-containing protein n=1 Tax=Escherichia coli TaxID=562 RepID=UPI00201D7239